MKTLITLFDYSGVCAEPFDAAGWQCLNIDLGLSDQVDMFSQINPIHYTDIENLNTDWFYDNIFENDIEVNGIIAFPPCLRFAQSGSQWWSEADKKGETDYYVNLVYQVLRAVDLCKPDFWYIENPVGRIAKLVPELQQFKGRFYQPNQYGDPYTKKTGLWGEFVMPAPTNIVEPVSSGTSESSMDYYWRVIRKAQDFRERRSYYRSITPEGFSKAFFQANAEVVSTHFYDAENDEYIDYFN